jgi:hypothetical protein
MVGSALVRRLNAEPVEIVVTERRALDLTRQAETEAWILDPRPAPRRRPGGREGRRHRVQQRLSGGFPGRQLGMELNVIRGLLHLPKICASAD